jgi:hypothetical protein
MMVLRKCMTVVFGIGRIFPGLAGFRVIRARKTERSVALQRRFGDPGGVQVRDGNWHQGFGMYRNGGSDHKRPITTGNNPRKNVGRPRKIRGRDLPVGGKIFPGRDATARIKILKTWKSRDFIFRRISIREAPGFFIFCS